MWKSCKNIQFQIKWLFQCSVSFYWSSFCSFIEQSFSNRSALELEHKTIDFGWILFFLSFKNLRKSLKKKWKRNLLKCFTNWYFKNGSKNVMEKDWFNASELERLHIIWTHLFECFGHNRCHHVKKNQLKILWSKRNGAFMSSTKRSSVRWTWCVLKHYNKYNFCGLAHLHLSATFINKSFLLMLRPWRLK